MNIYVNRIFHSLQGETSLAGFPSLFIRLGGCNLDCVYCDTDYAKSSENSKLMPIDEILEIAKQYSFVHHITITGGEPLMQKETFSLIKLLCDESFLVQVETNGSISIAEGDSRARYIVDVKTPSSGQDNSFNFENLTALSHNDEIKFVIGNQADYDFAKTFISKYLFETPAIVNFSPVFGMMECKHIAHKILEDKLNVRLNVQVHKVIEIE
jgi:7-carboxy-7-deazaguanine synthase